MISNIKTQKNGEYKRIISFIKENNRIYANRKDRFTCEKSINALYYVCC